MRKSLEVGTKLRKNDAPDYALEVLALFTPKGEPPHARARVSMTSRNLGVRLYSVSALEDTRLFVAVENPTSPHETH